MGGKKSGIMGIHRVVTKCLIAEVRSQIAEVNPAQPGQLFDPS
jgi:hypothetical protein